MQAELRVLDAVEPRPRRRDRAPAVVLRAVPAGPPDDVLPHGPHRPLPGRRRRPAAPLDGLRRQPRRQGVVARRADRRRRPGGAGGSPTPGRTRSTRSSPPSAGRSPAEGFDVAPNQRPPAGRRRPRSPSGPTRAASSAPGATSSRSTCSARWTRRSPATSPSPAPSSATSPHGRARRGHAAQHPLVPRAGARAVTVSLVTGGNGYFGQPARRPPASARGDASACSTSTSTGAAGRASRWSRPTSATPAAVARGRRRRRRRVPQRRPGAAGPRPGTCCARSTSTAPRSLLDACARRRRRQGRAHLVERGVRRPRVQPGAADDRAQARSRPTAHAKLAAEWACLRAAADGLDVTIVRPRTILGHGRLGIFGILFDWIADGADPIVLGDGSNRYQFVHADDLADVCLLPPARARARRSSTPAPTASARCARRSSTCAPTPAPGAQVRSLPAAPGGGGDAGQRRGSGLTPFAPYHWLMYAAVDVVRHRPRPRRARLDAAVVERRDARRELRLVPAPTGPSAAGAGALAPPPHGPRRRARRAQARHRRPAAVALMTPVDRGRAGADDLARRSRVLAAARLRARRWPRRPGGCRPTPSCTCTSTRAG